MPEILSADEVAYYKNYRASYAYDGPSVVGYDVETTMRGPEWARASPFFGDNKVLCAVAVRSDMSCFESDLGKRSVASGPHAVFSERDGKVIVAGHNLKFDLGWLRHGGYQLVRDAGKLQIWDTQIAVYLLSGQRDKFVSLDTLCKRYGLPVKDAITVEAMEKGTPEDVAPDVLVHRCATDALHAKLIAEQQIIEAAEVGMLPLCLNMMSAVLAVAECEYNGMYIDFNHFRKLMDDMQPAIMNLEQEFYNQARAMHILPADVSLNIASTKDVRALLFGGDLVRTVEVEKVYKNGKHKTVLKDTPYPVLPLYTPAGSTGTGLASTDDATLDALIRLHGPGSLPGILAEYRKLEKLYGTYVSTLPTFVDSKCIIHHTLHQCVTDTGRLSSARPNLQNVPMSTLWNIKAGFRSRFHGDGVLVEFDYKQIEIIGLAYKTGDPQLIDDIIHGRDIHFETGKEVFGMKMSKEERRIVKTINFGIIYGGGVRTLSKQSGQSEDLCKRIKAALFKRYPTFKAHVRNFQEELNTKLKSSTDFIDPETSNAKWVQWQSSTGRLYSFKESDFKPGSVSYTQSCNYPIQGFATGDLVPSILGRVYRRLEAETRFRQNVLLVSTVHDSIIFDVRKEVVGEFIQWAKPILEDAGRYLTNSLGLDPPIELPFKVEVSMGPSWGELEEVV